MRNLKKYVLSLCIIFLVVLSGKFYLGKKSVPDLTVMGYVNMSDGLGRQGPDLIQIFRKDIDVNFHHTRKFKNVSYPKKGYQIFKEKDKRWGKVVIFEDILWGPWDGSVIRKLKGCPKETIKIAYSMYEATKIPPEWVNILNRKFDAVIVPSPFLIEVYQNCGVKIPIFEIPLGVNLRKFLSQPLKKDFGNPFVFGNLSAGSDRKNHVQLIKAFAKAFGNDPSVQLRINARYSEKEVRNAITKEIAFLDYDNIKFTQNALSKNDYIQEFKKIDCYVSPAKGEGFSVQPREAMALGIPVIATNNTGQIPICESNLVKVVKSQIKKPALNPWGDYYGFNFDCEIDDLAAALIAVKKNFASYLSSAEKSREWASQYQYSVLKPFYRTIICPKLVVLGNENKVTKGCLVTNSTELFKKYEKLFGKEKMHASTESVFTRIYETAEWGKNDEGKGFSGMGSTLENAKTYISFLQNFIKEKNIKTVVDLGCGDWTFSKHINWEGLQYTGIDVVKFLIDQNQELYSTPNVRFVHADGASFDLPEADLLICKDVLQHLSNQDIQKIIKQFPKFKHCLLTNDITQTNPFGMNAQIDSGGLRPLDLTQKPFHVKGKNALKYEAHGNEKIILHVANESKF